MKKAKKIKKVEEKPKRATLLPEDPRLMPLKNSVAKRQFQIWSATIEVFAESSRPAALRDILILRLYVPELWKFIDLLLTRLPKKEAASVKRAGLSDLRNAWTRYLKKVDDVPIYEKKS